MIKIKAGLLLAIFFTAWFNIGQQFNIYGELK